MGYTYISFSVYEHLCRAYAESVLPLDVNMKIWVTIKENTCQKENCLELETIARLTHRAELKIFNDIENYFYSSSHQTILDINLSTSKNSSNTFLLVTLWMFHVTLESHMWLKLETQHKGMSTCFKDGHVLFTMNWY